MSATPARKLIALDSSVPREKALAAGSEKAALLVDYAKATAERYESHVGRGCRRPAPDPSRRWRGRFPYAEVCDAYQGSVILGGDSAIKREVGRSVHSAAWTSIPVPAPLDRTLRWHRR